MKDAFSGLFDDENIRKMMDELHREWGMPIHHFANTTGFGNIPDEVTFNFEVDPEEYKKRTEGVSMKDKSNKSHDWSFADHVNCRNGVLYYDENPQPDRTFTTEHTPPVDFRAGNDIGRGIWDGVLDPKNVKVNLYDTGSKYTGELIILVKSAKIFTKAFRAVGFPLETMDIPDGVDFNVSIMGRIVKIITSNWYPGDMLTILNKQRDGSIEIIRHYKFDAIEIGG